MALTPKQEMFVAEYLIDLNATQAAIRAGYSPRTARKIGQENLTKPDIQRAIQEAMDARSKKTEITAEMVLQHWHDIATADPNELVQLRRLNCRHCHGADHEYQWKDEAEYERAVYAAESAAREQSAETGEEVEPDVLSDAGGYGFDRLAYPNPDCPKCRGEGHLDLFMADTRKLGPKARLLYAGIKQTQAGIEIKMHDQAKALENVARHLGMFVDKVQHSGHVSTEVEINITGDDDDEA
ncbi:terminase small subunit [Paenibacillus apiarius]|uniref:Terminase small subunit n=1 Tax=Paenibacillus apiarius TaxID=46240 RepID=A0ABT4DQV1_9BACL|nr:terminase small subunit [Paenibacillus apiarius]MCY9513302.1 terminase small subunit [Paenibacillus apiarius]MCY9519726.1 terminase small subunit [Paenibacillus apiarius]MCY9553218.1 terminase small subunit [Paenibacillus apiarius]MCY9557068.1 terminase small subunit [Paenibacillus apiarius]MCY9682191.1 terminase small subunit [Paenibacillus apiarius]